MANIDKCLAGAIQTSNIATDTKTNATATASQAAPGAGLCLLVSKILVSASGAPAAAVQATVQTGTGPATLFTFRIPAAASWPFTIDFGTHPIQAPEASKVEVVVPALGASVACDVALFTIPSSV